MFLENWKVVTKKCKHGFKCLSNHLYSDTVIEVSHFTSMSSEAFEGYIVVAIINYYTRLNIY